MSKDSSDELAVRRLLADYSDAVWRLDADAYGATWATDGEWRLLGNAVTGRDNVVAFWKEFMKNFVSAWQVQHTAILDIGERSGEGRIYVNETVRAADSKVLSSMGIYHDQYVKEAGQWFFKKRHFDLVYFGPPDFSGRFFNTGPFGPGPTDPDPSRPATPTLAEAFA